MNTSYVNKDGCKHGIWYKPDGVYHETLYWTAYECDEIFIHIKPILYENISMPTCKCSCKHNNFEECNYILFITLRVGNHKYKHYWICLSTCRYATLGIDLYPCA